LASSHKPGRDDISIGDPVGHCAEIGNERSADLTVALLVAVLAVAVIKREPAVSNNG
jgi:hypothetical protein